MPSTIAIGSSGIVLNDPAGDTYGVVWDVNDADLVGQKPGPREEVGDRTSRSGQWDGTRFVGPRNRALTGTATAPNHLALHNARQRLMDAIGVSQIQVIYTEPGNASYTLARQQGELMWAESGGIDPGQRVATFSVGLYSSDPLLYSLNDTLFSLTFPSVTGGLTWPATWPATWASTSVSGVTSVTNPSSYSVPIRFRLTGPMTNASVSNPDTGEVLNFVNPAGALLAAGEYLDVDTDTHSVLLMGNSTRRSWAYGTWLQLPANTTTRIALSGVGDPAATLSGRFTPVRL